MHVAILTFPGFNELDSLIALSLLQRARQPDWRVSLCCPEAEVRSMNGVRVEAQSLLEEAAFADAVIVGSGVQMRQLVEDRALLARLKLDPQRQWIASQCSGALFLAKLGLLDRMPVCTDLVTKPMVEAAGLEVLDQPFFARGNLATAGGCLASQYLAAWILARKLGPPAAAAVIHYAAPVGEKDEYVARAMSRIVPYLPG